MEVPFRIYADFESILKPVETAQKDETKCFTEKCQKHIPCGYCFHTVSLIPGVEFSPIVKKAKN